MRNDYHLQRMWQKFSKLYFDNKLPLATVGWDETLDNKLHGLTLVFDITQKEDGATHRQATVHLHPTYKGQWWITYVLVLHEAIHAYLYPYMKHGRKFNNEIRRLASLGAYDGVL